MLGGEEDAEIFKGNCISEISSKMPLCPTATSILNALRAPSAVAVLAAWGQKTDGAGAGAQEKVASTTTWLRDNALWDGIKEPMDRRSGKASPQPTATISHVGARPLGTLQRSSEAPIPKYDQKSGMIGSEGGRALDGGAF